MPIVPAAMIALYVAALALLAAYAAHRLYLTVLAWRGGRDGGATEAPPPLPAMLPRVTVQLPLYNERYVAERLLDAAAALDWPRDRLELQVLDDSTDDTAALCARRVAALRARGIDAHHLHRTERDGFKAGALAAGLARARGELVLVLDADFVPAPDLLRRTVGHFADAEVGMVQVRWGHLNRADSLLTRVQALLLDGHFAVEQAVRARTRRFFNFNGTAGLWRRAAIDDAGGWHCDTLTEDLDLSYRALLGGWQFRYLLADAVPAELPATMAAFKQQQFRWAKGSVEVARKLLPAVLRAKLPWRVKLEAAFHLTHNICYLLTLVLALAMMPAIGALPSAVHAALALATLGTLAAYVGVSQRSIRATTRQRRGGGRAEAHCDLPLPRRGGESVLLVPAVVAVTVGICVNQARAVIEGAVGHRSPFLRTPKAGDARPRQTAYRGLRTLVPVAELALAAYFAAATVAMMAIGQLFAVPICATFAVGFGYVAVETLRR